MVSKTPEVHVWLAGHLRLAVNAANVALWGWDVDTDDFTMDELGFKLWGLPWRKHVTFEELSANIHPADRDRVRLAFAATRATLGSYENDFRIIVADQVRWVAARGRGDDVGLVGRTMFGIFLDVTDRKQAEEANELLAGEMSHRVKNLLALASALTNISLRSAATAQDMASELISRLSALGRAHDLVRPLPNGQGSAALLGDLLSVLLKPYDEVGPFKGRLRVAVERIGIGETAATALALVIHELATNSVKYGALSVPAGTLDVSTNAVGDAVVLTWLEQGGPAVKSQTSGGFGSKLVQRSVSGQLGGDIAYDWAEDGLKVTLKMDRAHLTS